MLAVTVNAARKVGMAPCQDNEVFLAVRTAVATRVAETIR
jgi:hypothetical protein